MSARLDKSLDEIISTTRKSGVRGGRGGRRGVRHVGTAPRATAPVGGIHKNAKGAPKAVPTGPSGSISGGKILVTGIPKDLSEQQIKEYFQKSIGPVKSLQLSYGPGGASRGIVNILFARPESATKAVNELNNIHIDNRPIRVELIIDATRAKAIPAPKGLGERITQPKSQPKSAATTKAVGAGTRGAKRGRGGKARNPRPAKKTAEELDSEMADYWQAGATTDTNGGTNGAAQPASGGDANMEDEIL